MIEEEKRVATAAGQAKQCAWMNWEVAEARKMSWSSLMTMDSLALSFLLHSTYNLLPTPANKQWGFTGDDTCAMCKTARGTLRHVLSSYGSSQMYTWRNNRVFAILAELTETQCRVANEQPTQDPKPCISFLQEGEAPPRHVSKPQGLKFLAAATAKDWKMAADLKEALHFPHHIVHTQERPDIVIWSDTVKGVLIVELTVPWEENMEEAFERKKLRYENLRMECEDKGWACQEMPIEVGCLGFIGRTTTSYLTRLGLTNRARQRATQQRKGHPAGSGPKSEKAPQLDKIALLPHPHPTPSFPPSPPLPPSLSPRVHTERPAALAPPSDITRWLKLLTALECGAPPVAAETT